MKIGILQTGWPPEELIEKHGTYAQAFERLLSGRGFEFEAWACLEGELPDNINQADGWLITGSKYGAYEDLPWIKPLEEFLRKAYSAEIPIVGICFGHQILAQALGGKVEKFSGGWAGGRTEYTFDGHDQTVPIMAWHQDQVIEAPADATTICSTDFCKHAALKYGNQALTIQPHPEFTRAYFDDLLQVRRNVLPEDVTREAEKAADAGAMDDHVMADMIAGFFMENMRE
jgi:GMP synthase (glutamine-hydrolysing)